MIIPYGTLQIVQLDSFYVTDSPLSVTKKAELAKFCLHWPVLTLRSTGRLELVSLNKVLTVSMSQMVLYVLLTQQNWQCFS